MLLSDTSMHLGTILRVLFLNCIYKITIPLFCIRSDKHVTIKQVAEFLLEKKENSLVVFQVLKERHPRHIWLGDSLKQQLEGEGGGVRGSVMYCEGFGFPGDAVIFWQKHLSDLMQEITVSSISCSVISGYPYC